MHKKYGLTLLLLFTTTTLFGAKRFTQHTNKKQQEACGLPAHIQITTHLSKREALKKVKQELEKTRLEEERQEMLQQEKQDFEVEDYFFRDENTLVSFAALVGIIYYVTIVRGF